MSDAIEKRRHIRYGPEEDTVIKILFKKNRSIYFKVALLIDESYSGCSVILTGDIMLAKGDVILLNYGDVGKRLAEVCWVKAVERNIYKIGLLFK
ncbi:MAG: hypothetical protein HQK76_09860 [Desulfobacterales bacterium]|nr:hypothetical protein [Desulfobacterales bacterium]